VIKAGSTAEVQLGGYDFTDDMQFFVHDERVELTALGPPGKFFVPEPPYWFGEKGFSTAFPIPREIAARIEVPADMSSGLVHWQVANANGASPAGVFFISDIDEIVESRRRDDDVQTLSTLPIAVSGRLGRISEVDRYDFTTDKNGPVTVDLMARRLGANFSAVIEVRDSAGKLIADVADTEGVDAQLTFVAQAGETYSLNLFDLDFRGNRAFIYRLAVLGKPAAIEIVTAKDDLLQLSEDDVSGPLTVPCAVTGNLDVASEEDRYAFPAKKGESWRIELNSRSLGSRLDVSLDVENQDGKVVATNDDLPGTLDAGLDFAAPADGKFTLVLRDMSGRIAPGASVYRLSIDRLQPGFSLTVPQRVNVPIGGKGELAVKAIRRAGFNGEIPIRVEGLPEHVTVADDLKILEGKNDLKISIAAEKDAASVGAMIRVVGAANVGDQIVEHYAIAPAGGNLCPRTPADNETSNVLLATTMKAPVTIALVDKNRQRAVHRGTTYPAPFLIKRDESFAGEVTLQMAAKQGRHRQGIHGPIMTVPAAKDEALYPCFMPEWLATDRTTRMVVMGVVNVPDPKGNGRSLMVAADARITMILEGALLKVAHRAGDLTVPLGKTFEVPVEVSRSAKLRQGVMIEIDVPEPLRNKVRAKPVSVSADEDRTLLKIETVADDELAGDWKLRVKAKTMQDGRWPVISQTDLLVRFVRDSTAVASTGGSE
jgi:hypothetical protein